MQTTHHFIMGDILIYADYMSQPSRAVLAFCNILKVPYKFIEIRVLRGETLTEDFAKISPAQTVPTLVHGNLCLYESHSILTYIASLFPGPDHWFPKDAKLRSRVNNYLHWHHSNIRFGCGMYLANKYAFPHIYGKSFEDVEFFTTEKRNEAFHMIEAVLAKGLYIAGTKEVSIADLAGYCEIVGMRWVKFDFSRFPFIEKWMQEIGNIPEVKEVHKTFEKLLPRIKI